MLLGERQVRERGRAGKKGDAAGELCLDLLKNPLLVLMRTSTRGETHTGYAKKDLTASGGMHLLIPLRKRTHDGGVGQLVRRDGPVTMEKPQTEQVASL